MAPALIPLYIVKPAALSTSTPTREKEAMQVQSRLHSRTALEQASSGNGVGDDTIVFIVLGVVCLFVILIGFYLRMSKDWGTWSVWRHTNRTEHAVTAATPTSQLSFSPSTIASPPRIKRARGGSKAYPPIASRPPQARRVTSLSVATSFTHSHITEEALSNFRASAYDLDVDLETEMLNSARDDVWLGHALAAVDGRAEDDVGAGEAMEARGGASPVVTGCVEGGVSPSLPTTQQTGDYENGDICESVTSASGSPGPLEDAVETERVVIGQAL